MNKEEYEKGKTFSSVWVAQLIGALPCIPKGRGFHSLSGHIPRLQVRYLLGLCKGDNQSMVSLSASLSLPFSLKSVNKFSREDFFLKEGDL